jgi:hypothetical protein
MIGGALDLGLVEEYRDAVRIGVGEKGKITERAGTPSRKGMAPARRRQMYPRMLIP